MSHKRWAVDNAVDKLMGDGFEKELPPTMMRFEVSTTARKFMRLARAASWVAVVFLAVAQARAAEDGVLWGPASGGISIGIKVEPAGRAEWHPGEAMRVMQYFRAKKPNIRVSAFGLVVSTKLHVVLPDGREVIWDPFKRPPRAPGGRSAGSYVKFDSEGPYSQELRLSDGKEIWTDSKTGERDPASLRQPGTYKIWAQCEVAENPNAPKNAWEGKASSLGFSWKVTDLAAEKRPAEMTAEQKKLVEDWRAGADVSEAMRTAINLTENEALAGRLMDIVLENSKSSTPAYKFLTARVGTDHDGEAGIDGPYLKRLAQWIVAVNEGKVQDRAAMSFLGAMQYAVVYLRFHSEDQPLRERAVTVLKQWSRSPAADAEKGPVKTLAWHALRELGVLKEGISKEHAVEALGDPQSTEGPSLTWTVTNPKLENPLLGQLTATMKEGKVQRWELSPKF
jgi:hypothetical protein